MNARVTRLLPLLALIVAAGTACRAPHSSALRAADDIDVTEAVGRPAEAQLKLAMDHMGTLQNTVQELMSPDIVTATTPLIAVNRETVVASVAMRQALTELAKVVDATYKEHNPELKRMRISAERVRTQVLDKIRQLTADSDQPSKDQAVLLHIQNLAHRINGLISRAATTGKAEDTGAKLTAILDYQQTLGRAVTLVTEIHREISTWDYQLPFTEKEFQLQVFCMGNEGDGLNTITSSLAGKCAGIKTATEGFALAEMASAGVEVTVGSFTPVQKDPVDRLLGIGTQGRSQLYQDHLVKLNFKTKHRIKGFYTDTAMVLPNAVYTAGSVPETTLTAHRKGADGALSVAWTDGLSKRCVEAMAKLRAGYRTVAPGKRFVIGMACAMPTVKTWKPEQVKAENIHKGPGIGAREVTAEMTVTVISAEFE